ncbi:ENTH domain-containing protein 1 isoform X2 [Lissotriton helveticus]
MSFRRSVKNFVNKFSLPVVKVREATSNDPWGPSGTLMLEIADLTYHSTALSEIMSVLWQRLNDQGKNWRHVYKSLTLVEYLLKNGSERVVQHCREGLFNIQSLEEFRYVDDSGREQGSHVREKARQVMKLLTDEDLLSTQRRDSRRTRVRMSPSMSFRSLSARRGYLKGQETDQIATTIHPPVTHVLRQPVMSSASPGKCPSLTKAVLIVHEDKVNKLRTPEMVQDLIVLSDGKPEPYPDDRPCSCPLPLPFPETSIAMAPVQDSQKASSQHDPAKKVTTLPRYERKWRHPADSVAEITVKPQSLNPLVAEPPSPTPSERSVLHGPSSPPQGPLLVTNQMGSSLDNYLNQGPSGSIVWSTDAPQSDPSLSWANSQLQTVVTGSATWTNANLYPAQWPSSVLLPGATGHAVWASTYPASTNPFLSWASAPPMLGSNVPVFWSPQPAPAVWSAPSLVVDVGASIPFASLSLNHPTAGTVQRVELPQAMVRPSGSFSPPYSYRAHHATFNDASANPMLGPDVPLGSIDQFLGPSDATQMRMAPMLPAQPKPATIQTQGPLGSHWVAVSSGERS